MNSWHHDIKIKMLKPDKVFCLFFKYIYFTFGLQLTEHIHRRGKEGFSAVDSSTTQQQPVSNARPECNFPGRLWGKNAVHKTVSNCSSVKILAEQNNILSGTCESSCLRQCHSVNTVNMQRGGLHGYQLLDATQILTNECKKIGKKGHTHTYVCHWFFNPMRCRQWCACASIPRSPFIWNKLHKTFYFTST